MEKLLTIINPYGEHRGKKIFTLKNRSQTKMARTKSRRRVSRRRRTRKNPYKHRPVVYSKRKRGRKGSFYRSKYARLPFKANRRKRRIRRRRNPALLKRFKVKQYFGKNRLIRGLALIGGIGVGAFGKGLIANMAPNMLTTRFGSLGLLILGAMVNQKGRKASIKSLGTGIVAFSIYDLLVQNVPMLAAYLPTIGAPTLNRGGSGVSGSLAYGRSTYGSSISQNSNAEVVGAFIGPDSPEIVGDDMDLADALEMAA